MLRSRVRRSFTVEVKSKNRYTPSWPEDPTPSPVNWAALDPAPETPSPFDAFWPDEAAVPAPAAPAEKPRRILPSLIVAEPEPEPEPETVEPASAREPRLPRVRRVKPPQARPEQSHADAARPEVTRQEVVRPAAIWSFADIADAASEPAVVAMPPVQARPAPVAPASVASRKVVKPRASKPALAPGERWKRRLPRSCR